MTMETYRLVVERTGDGEGDELSVDAYGEDGTIVESTRVALADYGLAPDGDGPGEVTREVTADVLSLDLAVRHDEAGFEVALLGDDEVLVRERVSHDDLGVESR